MLRIGGPDASIGEADVLSICEKAFAERNVDGKRLLFIIPDTTRTCPIPMLFRILYGLLGNRVSSLDFLIALGTHPPMFEQAILKHVGIQNSSEHRERYPKARFFNHEWKNPERLKTVGVISSEEMLELSSGRMRDAVDVRVNRMVFDYNLITIVGPVFPHEVVGFSGGNKYFFPGIAGQEIIDAFHWLGALITNPVINGTKDTPVRRVIDRAASMLAFDKMCIALVVHGCDLRGLFIGGSGGSVFGRRGPLRPGQRGLFRKAVHARPLPRA